MFGMFDVTNTGYITIEQYEKGQKIYFYVKRPKFKTSKAERKNLKC